MEGRNDRVSGRESGETLDDVEVFREEDLGRINAKNSHASPTPVLDGRSSSCISAQGTACLTLDGEIVWNQELSTIIGMGPAGRRLCGTIC